MHFGGLFLSHRAGDRGGIDGKPIILHGIVENGRHLIVDRFQIGFGIAGLDHCVLPFPDRGRGDVRDRHILQIWQNFVFDDMLLRGVCSGPQAGLCVGHIEIDQRAESHGNGAFHFFQVPAFIFDSVFAQRETSLFEALP